MSCKTPLGRFPTERWFQSRPLTYRPGVGGQHFDLSFVDPAIAQMAHPRILSAKMRIQASGVTVTGATFPARALSWLFSRIFIRDRGGPRYEVSGASHQRIEWIERLNPQIDVDVANGDDLDVFIHFPIVPRRVKRKSEYRWDLDDLRHGEFTLDCAANPITFVVVGAPDETLDLTGLDAQLTLWLEIIDEGKDEKKVRHVYRDFPLSNSYDSFPVMGRLRYALQDLGQNAGHTDQWATQRLTSRTLDISAIDHPVLVDKYLTEVAPIRDRPDAANDSDDGVLLGQVIPLFIHRDDHGITELPEVDSLDWKTDDTFGAGTFLATNDPRLICSWIEDRADACSEKSGAVVKTADGNSVSVASVAPDLQRKLPVVMPAGVPGG